MVKKSCVVERFSVSQSRVKYFLQTFFYFRSVFSCQSSEVIDLCARRVGVCMDVVSFITGDVLFEPL